MKTRNYLLILGLTIMSSIVFSQNVLAVHEIGEACSIEDQANHQGMCTARFGVGSVATNCRYVQCVIDPNAYDCTMSECVFPTGIPQEIHGQPGTVDSWDFSAGHQNLPGGPSYGGEYIDASCRFTCTGEGYNCPATEPFLFSQITNAGEPLQCEQTNFTGNSSACYTLAFQTCQQTTYFADSNLNSSGKVDMDGNQHSSPPTPTGTPSPGEVEFYDSGAVGGPGASYPYCNFQCTGIGSFCPTDPLFEEGSGPGQPLYCTNGTFQSGLEACQQLAEQACSQTTYYDNTINNPVPPMGVAVEQSFAWVWSVDSPVIEFNSIIGPKGETLEASQFFNNMAMQQLMDKNNNTMAPVKK